MVSRAQGSHGSGGRGYTETERDKVLNICRTIVGRKNMVTYKVLAVRAGMEDRDRTVRSIISENEGATSGFVNGGGNQGFFCAETQADERAGSRGMASQVKKMTERLQRRSVFGATLPTDE